jgi:hypothetical protein
MSESQSQNYFMTGGIPPVSSSWRQAPWDSRPAIFFNWILSVKVLMYYPLWREDGSVVYNCCWPSPAQSFSGPSPAGLMIIFYCLRFETPSTWRGRTPYLYLLGTGRLQALRSLFVASYDSQGYGGGIRPRLHMSELMLAIYLRSGPNRKQFLLFCMRVSCRGNVFTVLLRSNGHLFSLHCSGFSPHHSMTMRRQNHNITVFFIKP